MSRHGYTDEESEDLGRAAFLSGRTPEQARRLFDPDSLAGLEIDNRGLSVIDTQGHKVWNVEVPEDDGRRADSMAGVLDCLECGTAIPCGALYCRECRPYGFWHWLAYFSPIRWRRSVDPDGGPEDRGYAE